MPATVKEIRYPSSDGESNIWARIWEPEEKPAFILQLSHGMCEYVDRYAEFAERVADIGGVVYGNDHLGHGNTVGKNGTYGYFAKKDGYMHVIQDLHALTLLAKEQHPGLPVILMGHSMGSVLARLYHAEYPQETAAAIYTGTSGANNLTGLIRFLANVGKFFGRSKKPATMLSYLAFHKYNEKIPNAKSPNAWLTRDDALVEKYDADPWCTFKFTDSAAHDMANIIDGASGEKWAQKLPKKMPVLLASGDMDPVGNYGAGVREVYGWLKDAGMEDVTITLYPEARHEILNETNRGEVYDDILAWIKKVI